MRWLDSITDSMDMNASKHQEIGEGRTQMGCMGCTTLRMTLTPRKSSRLKITTECFMGEKIKRSLLNMSLLG